MEGQNIKGVGMWKNEDTHLVKSETEWERQEEMEDKRLFNSMTQWPRPLYQDYISKSFHNLLGSLFGDQHSTHGSVDGGGGSITYLDDNSKR